MKQIKNTTKTIVLFLPIVLFYILTLPKSGHDGDLYCWKIWAQYNYDHGLSNIYHSTTDYLPLFHYFLAFFKLFFRNPEIMGNYSYLIKIIPIFFEFFSTIVIYFFLNQKFNNSYKAFIFSLFYYLNVAVIYNSYIWGQVDGVLTFFAFTAILLAYSRYFFLSLLCIILALNFKLQAIIFLPLYIGIIIPLWNKSNYRLNLIKLTAALMIQFLILLPFIWVGDHSRLWKVVYGSVDKYPSISMNAFNFWALILPADQLGSSDMMTFHNISYKRCGLVLFFVSSIAALRHLTTPVYDHFFRNKDTRFSFEKILISGALIPLLFFFFNTQMHERYAHPALVFVALYSLLYRRYGLYFTLSLAYFMNLDKVLHYCQFNNYHTAVFSNFVIASLFMSVILYLFWLLYTPDSIKTSSNSPLIDFPS